MNQRKIISTVLSAAVLLSAMFSTSFAAEESQTRTMSDVTGSIKATLRFDYPQLLEKVRQKDIKVTLYKENERLGSAALDGTVTGELQKQASVVMKTVDGVERTTEAEIGYLDVDISALPLGTYSLLFEGDGYKPYKTPAIELKDYSQHVIVGTGDKTFSIGDVNGDGKVNKTDRDLLTKALGKSDEESLVNYDLNGDRKIDIIDLAYVNHQLEAEGSVQIFDTALIAQKAVNTDAILQEVAVQGSVNNLFTENNTQSVAISPKGEEKPLTLPIEFKEATEMEQIEVISPTVPGAITAGMAMILYEDGTTEEVPFDTSAPEGVDAISARAGTSSVIISLGKRVAVKKVIIQVTKTEGQDGMPTFAVVQEVKFLKDIVPENPSSQNLMVKNVTAVPLSKSVQLKWNEFPNITGYRIYYGEQNSALTNELTVGTNTALITGLKNLKTYYFTVVPVNNEWEGARSEIVSATPIPNKAPLKPDMIRVTPMDGALSLAWKATEDATYYRVFYKEATADKFVPYGDKISVPSVSIGGLTNGTEYLLYIIAGNDIGEGPRSDETTGTPEKNVVEPPEIPTLHMIDKDNIEKVEMGNRNNVLMSEYPNGFDVKNVADGDYGTHWTARVWWESNTFTFTFKEAKEMNYMVYVPRLDGAYRRSLSNYSIAVWDEEGNQRQLVSGKGIPINSTTTGYMILPFEKSKVKKLSVTVNQWSGSPTGVSLAEAVFYEADNLETDVRALFANDTYTELSSEAKADKAGTAKKIENLRAQANDANGYYVDKDILLDELKLAEELLNGNSSAVGYVKTGIESRSAGADSAKYKQSGSDLQPLGVVAYSTAYAEKKKLAEPKVTIYAHIPEGETVYLVPTQYYAEANAWQGSPIALQNGRNSIEIPQMGSQTSERGGALYLKYSGNRADEISLQVRQGATPIPTLELADWYRINEAERRERIAAYVAKLETHTKTFNMTQTGIYNATEVSMPNVLLSVPASQVLRGIKPTGADNTAAAETLYNNVLAWEDLMHIVNTTQGIDNTLEKSDMQSRQNIRYMRMFGNAFMYAAGSHIGVGYGSVPGLACGKPIAMLKDGATANNLFGWGIAHEIGHNMDKLGKAEITNNIYSLMAQTYDGKQNTLRSRLELSNKYNSIYDKVSIGRPGMSNDVFTQLGMYWQLHLAYDDGQQPMKFYNEFFKEWKKGTAAASYEDRFALTASKIANKNLTEFFERWGMRLSDSTKAALAAYPEETRSIFYLKDDSRRYRLNNGAAGRGETTAAAVLDKEKEKLVQLTFSTTADANTVLGYEIRRNGVPIAFTTENTYADLISSANNLSFAYTVQAIDMLGNKIGATANAGQIRISYAKTIAPDSYTLTRNSDGTVRAVMNASAALSGIKVTNAPQKGEFTVSIKRDEQAEFTTAKKGDFGKNETQQDYYVSYFNKPGADSSDTRIWIYDTKEITLTGIPENATVEFISYAGDDIAFNSDATVGRLGADYVYGDEAQGEVIKAGTLIVTGTYRGDPTYNTVQINGRFSTVNSETGEQTTVERAIDGYSLLFAEIPADGEVSDISDGIFIFVPNIQKEAELQEAASDCSGESLLPAQIKAELYRTDTAQSTESKRLTSDTIWIDSPSDDAMPVITLAE